MNEQIEAPTKESPKFHEKSGEYCYKQMEDFDQTYGMMCPIDYLELTNFARKLETHISSLEAKNKLLAEAAEVGVAYVIAAQNGLTFTQLRMKADMDVFEKALAQTEKEGE